MFLIFNTSALKGLDDTPQPKSKAAARWIVVKKKLQDSTTSAEQAFKLLLGKENFGRVRCFGRIVTPSHLKRKEEIVALKKEPANEWNNWARRFEGLEALLICFMKQNNSNLDDEALDDMIRNVVANENSNAAM
ncbi:hypothetical protein D0Y65_041867 [Glycine soja]|uniref:Uncharacterized protein n=1 Tax=Glycine soja TaxID=3848 RepID=A0A445GXI9_GLYSO|nr:hypothetical protein D0Y65_041867 [Glycine soja]